MLLNFTEVFHTAFTLKHCLDIVFQAPLKYIVDHLSRFRKIFNAIGPRYPSNPTVHHC